MAQIKHQFQHGGCSVGVFPLPEGLSWALSLVSDCRAQVFLVAASEQGQPGVSRETGVHRYVTLISKRLIQTIKYIVVQYSVIFVLSFQRHHIFGAILFLVLSVSLLLHFGLEYFGAILLKFLALCLRHLDPARSRRMKSDFAFFAVLKSQTVILQFKLWKYF